MSLCVARHEAIAKEMGVMSTELRIIKDALIGPDLLGGIVKKVADIDSKLKMGRTVVDWLKPVIIAVVSAGATVLFFKLLGL